MGNEWNASKQIILAQNGWRIQLWLPQVAGYRGANPVFLCIKNERNISMNEEKAEQI